MIWAIPELRAEEPVGNVEALTGVVQVERNGQKQLAKIGDPVFHLDKWHTQADGIAEIVFTDTSRIRLSSNTFLEITEYLYRPEEKQRSCLFSLIAGKARFIVKTLQDFKEQRFRVQTQTAIVGTRGTDFIVWLKSPTEVYVFCLENAIELFNRTIMGEPVILTPNMISQVSGNNPPLPPRFISPEERKDIINQIQLPVNQQPTSSGQQITSTQTVTTTGQNSTPTTTEMPSTTNPTQIVTSTPDQNSTPTTSTTSATSTTIATTTSTTTSTSTTSSPTTTSTSTTTTTSSTTTTAPSTPTTSTTPTSSSTTTTVPSTPTTTPTSSSTTTTAPSTPTTSTTPTSTTSTTTTLPKPPPPPP